MKSFQLSKVQIKNLYQAQEDMNAIDLEIERAKNAGIPLDPDLIPDCEECRSRLAKAQKFLVQQSPERKILTNESLS